MRAKLGWLSRVLWIVLLLLTSAGLLAQEALTQTYTSADGLITMSYPDGWTATEEDGLINFGGGGGFLQVSWYDYGENVTPLEVLEIGAADYLGFSEPESVVVGGWPGLRAESFDQHHTVVNFCNGTMALIIGFGDPASQGATWEAMSDTLVYGTETPQLCRGAFEGLTPMTAANAASLAPLAPLGNADVAITAIAFSPDGKLLAAAGDNRSVRLWSLLTGEEQEGLRGQAGDVTSMAFDQGAYQLALGSEDGQVRLWEMGGGTFLSQMQSHDDAVRSVARQQGELGFLIASGAADGSVVVYDMIMGGARPPLAEEFDGPVTSVVFNPDGTMLAAGSGALLRVWDAETGLLQSEVDTAGVDLVALAYRPDGAQIAYASADGSVWTWDLSSQPVMLAGGLAAPLTALAYHPNGGLIAAAGESAVFLLDAANGDTLTTLDLAGSGLIHAVAFSADGALLAVGGDSGGVLLFSASAGAATATDTTTTEAAGETTATTETGAATCMITAPGNANLRGGPGTTFERAGSLAAGQTAEVDGQAVGDDGLTWFRLTDGTWARSDVVSAAAECANVAVVDG